MASQSAKRAGSLEGFLKAFTGRLKAMASAQEMLTATRGRGAAIHQVATATLSTLAPGQTHWDGPELFMTPRAASALSLALHELAVNAVKHGALSSEAGAVNVRWSSADDGGFELDWVESGGPFTSAPSHRGFGTLLLEEVTGRELEGEVKSEFKASGLRVRIKASVNSMVQGERASAPADAPTAPVRTFEPSSANGGGKVQGMKVIIVEDAILLAMELEAGLEDAGATVLGSAALLEEAMALVDLPMDAAILDCNLNGSSVSPVAEALAARGVPFLFATGYGENRGAPEGFDAPIIRKPYDVAQITTALAELTGRN
jgi:two-component sensor histidine kinase